MKSAYRVLGFLVATVACVAARSAALDKDNSPWWAHIETLASDDFQGRLTGSPGYRKAADYVAGVFRKEGLKPAGTAGYFQNVGFEVQTIQTATSKVMLVSGSAAPIDVGDALVVSPGILQRKETQAPLVPASRITATVFFTAQWTTLRGLPRSSRPRTGSTHPKQNPVGPSCSWPCAQRKRACSAHVILPRIRAAMRAI